MGSAVKNVLINYGRSCGGRSPTKSALKYTRTDIHNYRCIVYFCYREGGLLLLLLPLLSRRRSSTTGNTSIALKLIKILRRCIYLIIIILAILILFWIFLPGCLLLIMSLKALYCLCYCKSTIAVIKEADKNSGSRPLRARSNIP